HGRALTCDKPHARRAGRLLSFRQSRARAQMLLVPIPEGVNWRRPPPVTLVLILLNALVFFGYQSGDTAREAELRRAYFQSSLPAVELPRYKARVAEEEPGMA